MLLHGFSDSDWAGIIQDRKSTSGFCFSMGSISCDISEALKTMDYGTPQVEECCSMVSLILIGQGVSRIGRVLPDSVLAWALLWFPG